MVDEVLAQNLDHLHLFLVGEAGHGSFDDAANRGVVDRDEARVVEEGDGSHDELAIESVRHAPVAGNGVAKVLDLKCTLQPRGEETSKWCNKRRKGGEDEDVELHGHDVESAGNGQAVRDER